MRVVSIHTYPVKGCRRMDHDSARVEPWGLDGDRRWLIVDEHGLGLSQHQHRELVTMRAVSRPGGLTLEAPGLAPLDLAEPTDGEASQVLVYRGRYPAQVRAAGPEADEWLGRLLGRAVRLVWLGDPAGNLVPWEVPAGSGAEVSFADGTPLLLANTASLDAFNDWLLESDSPEGPLPMTRFRPNVVISGAAPWAEAEWVGRRIRIGGAEFHGAAECPRCVVATIDQETGERGREPLRTLAARRNVDQKLLFGLQLTVRADPGGATRDGRTVSVGDAVEVLA
ncbi:MOSC domain-containing protein [Micromonospora sp. WMMD1102]|uniref:MOSC domain-containing protein n=1 Tax=Micromonospora sp. WMMD1102 TaxID=3016105 RepID=UPI0024151BBE|nr:MOSC N-terminal beta barrel domain-containing protein [Micromonospora sp. WMMD1102]MDG4791138.1 MOSC domain-containing protein [Micromonospora sp. WMMD1102]